MTNTTPSNSANILECTDCHKRTTMDEAKYRNFHAGFCGYCGGILEPVEELPSTQSDAGTMPSDDELNEILLELAPIQLAGMIQPDGTRQDFDYNADKRAKAKAALKSREANMQAEWEAEREKALIVIHRNLALRLIDDMYLYNRGIAGEQKQVIIDKLTMGSSLAAQTKQEEGNRG